MSRNTAILDRRILKALRKRQCLTQEELARRAGYSKKTVENAEAEKPLETSIVADLASVFGVRPIDLFRREEIAGDEETGAVSQLRLGNAPPMPTLLVGRIKDIDNIRDQLLNCVAHAQVTSEMAVIIVRGWPGVGKTSIAKAFAHDADTQRNFPDGILWTSLGQSPSLDSVLKGWCQSLQIEITEGLDTRQLSERIAGWLSTRAMLLIIDDVWREEDANPLLVGGRHCATLVTTRLVSVAESLSSNDGDIYHLDVLSEEGSLELLNVLAPDVVKKFQSECQELVKELECLPLALQVAGRLLRIEFRRTGDVKALLNSLYSDAQHVLQAPVPADIHALLGEVAPTVVALFRRSTDMLSEESRERFALLAPFAPKPAIFKKEHLAQQWDVDDPVPTIRDLIDFGLLEPVGQGRYQIHALLIAHARSLCKE